MQVRFYAVGREVAGVESMTSDAATVRELAIELGARYGERMTRLVDASTLLHNGVRRSSRDDVALLPTDTVDLLPPFAGG